MDAAAQSLGYDPAAFAETPGAAPDCIGYVSRMQDPQTSFENYAPGPPDPSATLWHPGCTSGFCSDTDTSLMRPVHPCGTDDFSLVPTYPNLANATGYGDEAGTNYTQCYNMGTVQLEKITNNDQNEAPFNAGHSIHQAAQSDSSPSSGLYHCGLNGCKMIFVAPELLENHQRYHAKHHWVASQSPFICECGQHCAKLDTLQRHIRRFQTSSLNFRCQELDCPSASRRKDHLVQHLRHGRKFSDAELQATFTPRKAITNIKPVCHFTSCPYYRNANFRDQPMAIQEETMPFAKQADYTKFMRDVHEWSPYPCTVPFCDKSDKKGYFSQKSLQKHRDEQHPEAEPLILEPKAVQKLPCGLAGCRRKFHPGALHEHRGKCRRILLEEQQAAQRKL
ncbi:hypothetical protein PG994_012555 [Apiospora phragmitis]|uniref:C2H2-type domain-containing protein n=1 Tax=Apiospora phragmitis TaxID=2905665 RepID=A0ABR1TY86_9PEZI